MMWLDSVDADVPADMAADFGFRQAERAEASRDPPAGMVSEQKEGRCAVLPDDPDRTGLVLGEQR